MSNPSEQIVEALRSTWLFNDLSKDEATNLGTQFRVEIHTYKGHTLVKENSQNDSLWLIAEGELDVKVGENSVASLASGEMLGEQSWLDGLPTTASIRTKTEKTILFRMKLNDFDKFLEKDKDLHILILRKLAINLSQRLRAKK